MSNQITPQKLMAAAPLIMLTAAVAAAVYFGIASTPLPRPRNIQLHPALETLPTELKQEQQAQREVLNGTLFYHQTPTPKTEAAEALLLPASTPRMTEVKLTSVAGGNAGAYCIVNGEFFVEGESNTLFTVLHIGPDEVTFSSGNQHFTLRPGGRFLLMKETGRASEKTDSTDSTPLPEKG